MRETEDGENRRLLAKDKKLLYIPLQSSIYISGFLLTSDRTDTRTRALRHS